MTDLKQFTDEFSFEDDMSLEEVEWDGTTEYHTPDYIIMVGKGIDDRDCYQIVNRATAVVEVEDNFLPRTIKSMIAMQGNMEEMRTEYHKPKLKIIGEKGEEGESGIH